jgi:hypothetical protein
VIVLIVLFAGLWGFCYLMREGVVRVVPTVAVAVNEHGLGWLVKVVVGLMLLCLVSYYLVWLVTPSPQHIWRHG